MKVTLTDSVKHGIDRARVPLLGAVLREAAGHESVRMLSSLADKRQRSATRATPCNRTTQTNAVLTSKRQPCVPAQPILCFQLRLAAASAQAHEPQSVTISRRKHKRSTGSGSA